MENKSIPKVIFKIKKLKWNILSINHFLNLTSEKNIFDWSGEIFKFYPKLKEVLKKGKTKLEKKKISERFFKNYFKENKIEIERKRKEFQEEWNKINDKYMKALAEVLEIEWPKKDRKIYALLSLNPNCPRWINERVFDVYFNFSPEIMKSMAMHEILHFLYFEKWKQIFPKANEKEFESPYLIWKLSEMVPKAILSDERIQKIQKHKPVVYDEWKFAKIDEKPLFSQIGKFYYEKKDFEDFIKKSWEFVNKYEKEINKI